MLRPDYALDVRWPLPSLTVLCRRQETKGGRRAQPSSTGPDGEVGDETFFVEDYLDLWEALGPAAVLQRSNTPVIADSAPGFAGFGKLNVVEKSMLFVDGDGISLRNTDLKEAARQQIGGFVNYRWQREMK